MVHNNVCECVCLHSCNTLSQVQCENSDVIMWRVCVCGTVKLNGLLSAIAQLCWTGTHTQTNTRKCERLLNTAVVTRSSSCVPMMMSNYVVPSSNPQRASHRNLDSTYGKTLLACDIQILTYYRVLCSDHTILWQNRRQAKHNQPNCGLTLPGRALS